MIINRDILKEELSSAKTAAIKSEDDHSSEQSLMKKARSEQRFTKKALYRSADGIKEV